MTQEDHKSDDHGSANFFFLQVDLSRKIRSFIPDGFQCLPFSFSARLSRVPRQLNEAVSVAAFE